MHIYPRSLLDARIDCGYTGRSGPNRLLDTHFTPDGVATARAPGPVLPRRCDMTDKREKHHRHEKKTGAVEDHNQRKRKRREKECEGYAYIEMVGWMDRREKCRRDDDRFRE